MKHLGSSCVAVIFLLLMLMPVVQAQHSIEPMAIQPFRFPNCSMGTPARFTINYQSYYFHGFIENQIVIVIGVVHGDSYNPISNMYFKFELGMGIKLGNNMYSIDEAKSDFIKLRLIQIHTGD